MTQIVLNGGTKTTQDLYTGPENELSVDVSNRNLRLHDGVTPGGHAFLNRDNLDVRYQARSTELDGITGLEPQQRGFLVRLGPADYRLRTITVDPENLVIQYPNGYEANPFIQLAAVIDSPHIWNQPQIYNELVQFNAGIEADVTGNVIGNLTGNAAGDHTGTFTGESTGDHFGTFTGDVDVTGSALLLDDSQIEVSKIADLVDFIKLHGFPAGAITIWSGADDAIPDGWFLCNGLNGTPDLRNKFLVGAGPGADYAVADVGGFLEHTPTTTIANSVSHTHAVVGATANSPTGYTVSTVQHHVDAGGSEGSMTRSVSTNDPTHGHAFTTESAASGIHDHTGTVSSFDNRPPYYALCYIMKG